MPNLIENWHQNPLSSLSIVRCYPWTMGKFALMGDSCHATVPFYGQGMNAGFERLCGNVGVYNQHQNWDETFKAYQKQEKQMGMHYKIFPYIITT